MFDPDWVVHPGATLRDWMEEQGITVNVLAIVCGRMDPKTMQGILDGKRKLTPAIADRLAFGTGIPRSFWLALEHNFRVGRAAGKSWTP